MSRSMLRIADQENTPNSPGYGTPLLYNFAILDWCTPSKGARASDRQGALRGAEHIGPHRFKKKTKIVEPSTHHLRSALRRLHNVLELVESLGGRVGLERVHPRERLVRYHWAQDAPCTLR